MLNNRSTYSSIDKAESDSALRERSGSFTASPGLKTWLKSMITGKARPGLRSKSETDLNRIMVAAPPVTVTINEKSHCLDVAQAGLFTFHKSNRKGQLTKKKLNVNYVKDIDFTTYFLNIDDYKYYCFWSKSSSLSFYVIPSVMAQGFISDKQLADAIVGSENAKDLYLNAEYARILNMLSSYSKPPATSQPVPS